jgi:hypothetical protein
MLLRLVAALLVIAALAVGYFWLAWRWSYSSGERAGWVQKFSHKGWLCKTWEGELALVSLPGSMVEKFHFTVHDEAVARTIQDAMTRPRALTTLHYEEKVGLPTSCFGDTRHFVTRVTVNSEVPAAAAPVPAAPASAASAAQ